jgi:hypothetical protein
MVPLFCVQAWMVDGLSAIPSVRPPKINNRLNAQLRTTIVALNDAISNSVAQSIKRRTEDDLLFWYWDGTQPGKSLPFECGSTVANKALRWCLTDTHPGGAKDKLVVVSCCHLHYCNVIASRTDVRTHACLYK